MTCNIGLWHARTVGVCQTWHYANVSSNSRTIKKPAYELAAETPAVIVHYARKASVLGRIGQGYQELPFPSPSGVRKQQRNGARLGEQTQRNRSEQPSPFLMRSHGTRTPVEPPSAARCRRIRRSPDKNQNSAAKHIHDGRPGSVVPRYSNSPEPWASAVRTLRGMSIAGFHTVTSGSLHRVTHHRRGDKARIRPGVRAPAAPPGEPEENFRRREQAPSGLHLIPTCHRIAAAKCLSTDSRFSRKHRSPSPALSATGAVRTRSFPPCTHGRNDPRLD